MTRILHVLDHSLPMQSGYSFRTRAILKAQQAAGDQVRAITGLRHTAQGPDIEEIDGLTFHRTRGSASGPAGMREWREIGALAQAIGGLVEDWRPDIIHAHSPALCGFAALRAARKHGIALVYEIRAFWEDAAVGNGATSERSLRYKLTRQLENLVVAGADHVMTICKGLRDDLVARGVPAAKIGIMPNGVDLTLFGDPGPRDAALAAHLGIGSGPVIGFIGSLYDYEGLDDLIASMPAIVAAHPEARLLVVGGGPMEEALKARAAASPAARAILFAGRVPHGEVGSYYSLCEIMAYPRKRSRLTDLVTPLKPLEAMAQNRLVVASDVGGHRELIEHGMTGALFAADDPPSCARTIAELLAQPELWESLREAGRAHVREHHDWARNVIRYQTVYQDLIRQSDSNRVPAAA
jgi:PEP-CTERM/exosortase A-associated glycosyltransferase